MSVYLYFQFTNLLFWASEQSEVSAIDHLRAKLTPNLFKFINYTYVHVALNFYNYSRQSLSSERIAMSCECRSAIYTQSQNMMKEKNIHLGNLL